MKFRTRFDSHKRYLTDIGTESQTHQSFKQECDINTILERYQESGVLQEARGLQPRAPFTADMGDEIDFETAQNLIIEAQNAFDSLPSKIRARFDNNPSSVLSFIADERNREEAITLGLIDRPAESPKSTGETVDQLPT